MMNREIKIRLSKAIGLIHRVAVDSDDPNLFFHQPPGQFSGNSTIVLPKSASSYLFSFFFIIVQCRFIYLKNGAYYHSIQYIFIIYVIREAITKNYEQSPPSF